MGDTALTGWLWSENAGWISLSCANTASCGTSFYGVANDGTGRLSGYAWAENGGWIDFAPFGGGVVIDGNGFFGGTAWGENIGWLNFGSPGPLVFGTRTAWCPALDTTPPASTAGGFGSGWSKLDVLVALTASDNSCGGGVAAINYTLDANPQIVLPGAAVTANITTEGSHNILWFAVDNAGNAEAAQSATIRIDKTPPVVTITTPPAGATYFTGSVVPADYLVSDLLSGPASPSGSVPPGTAIDTVAAGAHSFTITGFDSAGNSTVASKSYTVVAPQVSPALSAGTIITIAGGGTLLNGIALATLPNPAIPGATAAQLSFPWGVAVDSANNVYLSNTDVPYTVRKVDAATGLISTVAGNGIAGNGGDNGPATSASFQPFSLALDRDPARPFLFIVDSFDHRVRRVDLSSGIITTAAGNGTRDASGNTPALSFPHGGQPWRPTVTSISPTRSTCAG